MIFRFRKTAKDTDKKTDKKEKLSPKDGVRAVRPISSTRDPQSDDSTQSA